MQNKGILTLGFDGVERIIIGHSMDSDGALSSSHDISSSDEIHSPSEIRELKMRGKDVPSNKSRASSNILFPLSLNVSTSSTSCCIVSHREGMGGREIRMTNRQRGESEVTVI